MEGESVGKVWLVGAGPGDAGLLTRKGYDVLQQADVVVYDALVGDGVLSLVPRSARAIDVGKRASDHTMPQEQISQVLLDEALSGNRVVRLKGGDPFVFGRGGEELELLAANDVPFEVVPGVTSAIAVPAYNGIPITHRDFSSSVHIVAGHRRDDVEGSIDFEALAHAEGTLVFLMGARSLPGIMEGLIRGGMDPDTPAAVLQEGTTAGQRRVVATVSTLAEKAAEVQMAAPAIIVVGGVCAMAGQLAWREKLPLSGCKVVVTRPAELISTMSGRLRALGAEVLDIPAIATVPIPGNEALKWAFEGIALYDWLAFTSPSGVRIFFDEMVEAGVDHRLVMGQVAALGQGTASELRKHGYIADLVPEEATGEALGKALAATAEPGSRILIPRARMGNPELVEALVEAGHEVDDVPTYDTVPLQGGLVDITSQFEDGRIFCAVFTSSSGVRAFADANPGLDYSKVRAACIGKKTAATAESFGMATCMSDEASMDSLAELVVRQFAASK